MKLGFMQPYFFPYIGYFDLINSVDRWIVADSVQYIRRGWINRNRILNQHSAWSYITIPVCKSPQNTPISDIQICSSQWRNTILHSLLHYRKHAPFFDEVYALVEDCINNGETAISRMNVSILTKVCSHLGIPFTWEYLSEMNLSLGPIKDAGDWAVQISRAVGASEYINPPGGTDLYLPEEFERHGTQLRIKELIDFQYNCAPYDFIPHMSIVDVLMWNPPADIKRHLDTRRET